MKRFFLILLFISIIFQNNLFSADQMQVAVIDLKPKGASRILANAISDIIRSEMVKTGLFIVIERSQMNEIFKEQGLQQTGCTDSNCAVQMGKLLSAKKILMGEVNKIGKAFMITVRIVDVEKGVAEYAANEKAASEDVLDISCKKITKMLVKNIMKGKRQHYAFKSMEGYYLRSIFPGWGQLYAGQDTKGYIFMGSFVSAIGLSVYGYYNYTNAEKAYNDVPRDSGQSEFDDKYNAKVKAANLFYIFGSITAAVYLAHWVDILFFTEPDSGEEQAVKKGPSFYFTFAVTPYQDHQNNKIIKAGAVFKF